MNLCDVDSFLIRGKIYCQKFGIVLIPILLQLFSQLLQDSIRPDTALVSIMTVNNEIGVRQDITEIGKIVLADFSEC